MSKLVKAYKCTWLTSVGSLHSGYIRLTEEEALKDLEEIHNYEKRGFVEGNVLTVYVPEDRIHVRIGKGC